MVRRTNREDFLQVEVTVYQQKSSCLQFTALLACWLLLASLVANAGALAQAEDTKITQTTANNGSVAVSTAASPDAGPRDAGDSGGDPLIRRLDPRVKPLLYQVYLRPFLGEGTNFTFHGHVNITFTIRSNAAVDSVVFHVKQLNISTDEIGVTFYKSRSTIEANSTTGSGAGPTPVVVDQQADPQQETYTVRVSPALQPGLHYVISIPFRGELLEETLAGFYRTSYQEDGRTKWIALTHFEATEARSVFPCFDEPGIKARFQINIAHSSNYTALSNMPIIRSEHMLGEPGWIVDHFDTSPPMSTYLVTFTVSELVFVSADEVNHLSVLESSTRGVRRRRTSSTGCSHADVNRTSVAALKLPEASDNGQQRDSGSFQQSRDTHLDATGSFPAARDQKKRENTAAHTNVTNRGTPVKIRILVRPNFRDQAKYVLTIAPKVLQFYADYFDTPYPLPKLDFTSIPGFLYGGMENWGAITYWDYRILVGPKTSSDELQTAAVHIVHEFSHQWFGDLVTVIWWSETWLKEGFATFLEYLVTDYLEPTWVMPDKFLYQMHRVMRQDSTRFTRPPFSTVETVPQLIQAFDSVSYFKGACLFRMLNLSITEDVFRKGAAIFVDRWKYFTVNSNDLWWAMNRAVRQSPVARRILPANTTVKQVMDSWIMQPGFPVITVTRNYVTGSVTIKQARFSIDGRPLANSSSQAWYVPVSYQTQKEVLKGAFSTVPRVWLGTSDEQRSVTIEGVLPHGSRGAAQWLLINLQQTGFYKVNYDLDNWKLLVHQLTTNPLLLPAATRAQLLSDAFSLARAGALPYGIALNMTRYLRYSYAELSPVVWQAFLEETQFLEDVLYVTTTYSPLKSYMQSVLERVIGQVQTQPQPGDSLPRKQLRAMILSRLVWIQRYNWWALVYFSLMASPNYVVPVDSLPAIYCGTILEIATDTQFNSLLERLNETTSVSMRNNMISGLMCSHEPAKIAMLLNAPLEGTILQLQDAPTVWQAVPRNPAAHAVAFDYIRENWSNLTRRFPDTDYPINDMLDGATAGLNTEQQLNDLIAFRDSHQGQFNFTATTMERAVEALQEKISWRQRFESDIAAWLSSPASGLSSEKHSSSK